MKPQYIVIFLAAIVLIVGYDIPSVTFPCRSGSIPLEPVQPNEFTRVYYVGWDGNDTLVGTSYTACTGYPSCAVSYDGAQSWTMLQNHTGYGIRISVETKEEMKA